MIFVYLGGPKGGRQLHTYHEEPVETLRVAETAYQRMPLASELTADDTGAHSINMPQSNTVYYIYQRLDKPFKVDGDWYAIYAYDRSATEEANEDNTDASRERITGRSVEARYHDDPADAARYNDSIRARYLSARRTAQTRGIYHGTTGARAVLDPIGEINRIELARRSRETSLQMSILRQQAELMRYEEEDRRILQTLTGRISP